MISLYKTRDGANIMQLGPFFKALFIQFTHHFFKYSKLIGGSYYFFEIKIYYQAWGAAVHRINPDLQVSRILEVAENVVQICTLTTTKFALAPTGLGSPGGALIYLITKLFVIIIYVSYEIYLKASIFSNFNQVPLPFCI